jgi:hypothetical protein
MGQVLPGQESCIRLPSFKRDSGHKDKVSAKIPQRFNVAPEKSAWMGMIIDINSRTGLSGAKLQDRKLQPTCEFNKLA